MSLFADCQTLIEYFNGCAEEVVQRIKVAFLDHLCDPNNHSCTAVRLPIPVQMEKDSILVRPIFTRGDDRAVLTVIVDSSNAIHTFPYSPTDSDLVS